VDGKVWHYAGSDLVEPCLYPGGTSRVNTGTGVKKTSYPIKKNDKKPRKFRKQAWLRCEDLVKKGSRPLRIPPSIDKKPHTFSDECGCVCCQGIRESRQDVSKNVDMKDLLC
jgi:hypothetical protein